MGRYQGLLGEALHLAARTHVLAREEASARELLAALRLHRLRRLLDLVVGAAIMVVLQRQQHAVEVPIVIGGRHSA